MDREQIQSLVSRPAETLQCELKSWLDLSAPDERAKVARALIALRNRNGGVLIFGIDDKTLAPATTGRPTDVQSAYHADKIQEIVKEFAVPPFAVEVVVAERDQLAFPVLVVSSGVKYPVLARRPQTTADPDAAVRQYAVYFRTVNNGRVESTEPRSAEDWNQLLEICFDNREADVGRFLRRHLGGIVSELGLQPAAAPAVSPPALEASTLAPVVRSPREILEEGRQRFEQRITFLKQHHPDLQIPDYIAWREVGVVLDGEVRPLVGQHLLSAVFPRHPHLSGWPLWIDSRSTGGATNAPYPRDGGWEASILMNMDAFVIQPLVDFWRIDPRGEFYHRRSLEDDIWARIPAENRRTTFDIINAVKRVAEALATVQAFSQGMLVNPDAATIRASFRWTNLRGRRLISIEAGRDFFAPTPAYDDVSTADVEMPATTAPGALVTYVTKVVTPLFATFGYQVPGNVITELTQKTISFGRQ